MPAAIQQSQMESDRLSAIKTIDSEIRAIEELKKSLDAESLTKALDFMQNSTGRIIITGMGKSGHIGKKIAATLASTGTPSFFVHPAEVRLQKMMRSVHSVAQHVRLLNRKKMPEMM